MRKIEGLLLDLDGTVYLGRELIPGAASAIESLRDAGVPIIFTTNTSRKSRRDVAISLQSMGLSVREEEILTAPVAAARWLDEQAIERIHLMVPASAREDFGAFELDGERPQAVVVGDLGSHFTFERMNAAFKGLRSGARLVAIHKNRYWITENGPTLDAGPFVAALEYASGQLAELVGKPSPAFFDAAASSLGVRRDALAVVGDDLESDVRGGRAAGLITVQVQTGKFDAGELDAMPVDERPHYLVPALADVPALLR